MASAAPRLLFTVRRCEPELVAPAKSTPRETRELSDIDDQEGLRFLMQGLQFYRHNPSVRKRDPVKVIREALAQTLVFYYPFAGRLREGPGKKLVVDCRGEGVVFVEADADVKLEQFGDDPIHPPFPCSEELLYNVPGSDGIINCPLFLVQVTRLKCGGFVVGTCFNHTMSDATGIVQFLKAWGEMARGARSPSVLPVWERELLNARDPPRITCAHNEYIITKGCNISATAQLGRMTQGCFLLDQKEISAIRRLLPSHVQQCSRFELITACLWRCCTIAFQPDPSEKVHMKIAVNARPRFNPPLPRGYYGNVFANPIAVTTAGKLLENPVGYTVGLIRDAKNTVTEEYMRSVADLMVIKGRPPLVQFKNEGQPGFLHMFNVSDVTQIGFAEVDYGWGKAAYSGPPKGWMSEDIPGAAAAYLPFKNKEGEDGIMIIVSLPATIMERFEIALQDMLKVHELHSRL